MDNPQKRKCVDCGWIGLEEQLLKGASPFNPQEALCGCPLCLGVECFVVLCDETGCTRECTCGTPTLDGYRSTCGRHVPKRLIEESTTKGGE